MIDCRVQPGCTPGPFLHDWSPRVDLNDGPAAYQTAALTGLSYRAKPFPAAARHTALGGREGVDAARVIRWSRPGSASAQAGVRWGIHLAGAALFSRSPLCS